MNNGNDNESKKNEILEKSKAQRKDEGFDFAEIRGNKIGVILYAIVALILLAFSVPKYIEIVNVIAALSFTWTIGGTLSYYRFTRKKIYLFATILSAIATMVFVLLVILALVK